LQKSLIAIGVALVALGLLWPLFQKSGLGRLPGDIRIERDNFQFYFPVMTAIVVSLVISLIIWFFRGK
jgi:hypothetical protein